jgi:hypothetical protein
MKARPASTGPAQGATEQKLLDCRGYVVNFQETFSDDRAVRRFDAGTSFHTSGGAGKSG